MDEEAIMEQQERARTISPALAAVADDEELTLYQAADITRFSYSYLAQEARKGELHAYKGGPHDRAWLVRASALKGFVTSPERRK